MLSEEQEECRFLRAVQGESTSRLGNSAKRRDFGFVVARTPSWEMNIVRMECMRQSISFGRVRPGMDLFAKSPPAACKTSSAIGYSLQRVRGSIASRQIRVLFCSGSVWTL